MRSTTLFGFPALLISAFFHLALVRSSQQTLQDNGSSFYLCAANPSKGDQPKHKTCGNDYNIVEASSNKISLQGNPPHISVHLQDAPNDVQHDSGPLLQKIIAQIESQQKDGTGGDTSTINQLIRLLKAGEKSNGSEKISSPDELSSIAQLLQTAQKGKSDSQGGMSVQDIVHLFQNEEKDSKGSEKDELDRLIQLLQDSQGKDKPLTLDQLIASLQNGPKTNQADVTSILEHLLSQNQKGDTTAQNNAIYEVLKLLGGKEKGVSPDNRLLAQLSALLHARNQKHEPPKISADGTKPKCISNEEGQSKPADPYCSGDMKEGKCISDSGENGWRCPFLYHPVMP